MTFLDESGHLTPVASMLLCAVGVMISILIPLLRKSTEIGTPAGVGNLLTTIWNVLKPYLRWAALSILVSVIVVAGYYATSGAALNWWTAILIGYGWDSTLQKLTGKP